MPATAPVRWSARGPARAAISTVAVAVVAVLLLAGCSGSDGSDGAEGIGAADDTTTTALAGGDEGGDAGDEATDGADGEGGDEGDDGEGGDETTTTTEVEQGGDIVGVWTADAGDILTANTALTGGVGGLDCEGPVTLDIRDDGTFTQTAEASCTAAGTTATATISSAGTYEVSGETLTIASSVDDSSITVAGTTQSTDMGLGTGEATYSVDGDVLTLTFTDASVGTVTQTYVEE